MPFYLDFLKSFNRSSDSGFLTSWDTQAVQQLKCTLSEIYVLLINVISVQVLLWVMPSASAKKKG